MANIFEFHFNPLARHSLGKDWPVFDTFCFIPQTFFEKKQGYLYIVAQAKNLTAENKNILAKSAQIIKKYFYQKPIFASHDSFQLGLNQANDFLKEFEIKSSFAVMAVGPKCNIKVSKAGDIKIILFRNQEAYDIGANFTIENLSGKIFPDVIEGSLQKNDRILMATNEVFQSLESEKIIEELCFCQKPKMVKQIFKQKKKIVREFSGACLLAFIKPRPIISLLSRLSRP